MRTFIKRMKGAGLRYVIGAMSIICCLSAVKVNAQVDMTKRVQELKDLHWGTFSGWEWTGGVSKDTDYAKLFPAETVDTDQWALTAREAEMGYILFLTKHHDGFCLWDTKTTARKVTNAPLKVNYAKWTLIR